jgi:hypothetical protein
LFDVGVPNQREQQLSNTDAEESTLLEAVTRRRLVKAKLEDFACAVVRIKCVD